MYSNFESSTEQISREVYGFGSQVVVAKTWPHLHCAAPNPRNGSRYRVEIGGQGSRKVSCYIVQKGLYSV